MPKSLYVDPDQMRSEGKIVFEDIPINTYKKTVKEEFDEGNYTKEDLLRIFRDMTVCREFEDMLNQIKTQARYADVETTYPGPAHLSLGQEAAAVGEAYLLGKKGLAVDKKKAKTLLTKALKDEEDGAKLREKLRKEAAGGDTEAKAVLQIVK